VAAERRPWARASALAFCSASRARRERPGWVVAVGGPSSGSRRSRTASEKRVAPPPSRGRMASEKRHACVAASPPGPPPPLPLAAAWLGWPSGAGPSAPKPWSAKASLRGASDDSSR